MRWVLKTFVVLFAVTACLAQSLGQGLVRPGPNGKLLYTPDQQGNIIPDFSNCGYRGGGVALPRAVVKLTIQPAPGGDDTDRIQKAIDQIAAMPIGTDGLRGAVLLAKGTYRVGGQLKIAASGVVIRGEGQADGGTMLIAEGKTERPLVLIAGSAGPKEIKSQRQKITENYVPVGAHAVTVSDVSRFRVGQSVYVTRVGNAAWIHEIGMDQIKGRPANEAATKQWTPFDLPFDRVITKIEQNRITFDAPIVCAIEEKWGGGFVVPYEDAGRIENSGVENLRADSAFDPAITLKQKDRAYHADEKHATHLVAFDNSKSCWARDVTAIHFYHGVADVRGRAKWTTVQDCTSLDPVSEITGGRRYSFSVEGQLTLVLRCRSKEGRHAFVFGARVPGPNAFVDCKSEEDYATSEPHHRWSTGGLYDNCVAHIAIQDRQWMGSGHGWAGANYVVWNGEGTLICQSPPTATNWAIGFVGKKEKPAFDRPQGVWESYGKHVEPAHLYQIQLEDRLGKPAANSLRND